MSNAVLFETDGPIGTLRLNRPEARNAYDEALKIELLKAIDQAESDDALRVLIITGNGKSFSAGGDLKAMRDRSGMFAGEAPQLRTQYRFGLQEVTRRLNAFEKPAIAAINGAAIGAGLGLALNCDIRIAARGAKLGATFAKVGLIPGDGTGYLLTRIVGFAKALELVMTARVLTADQALSIGLVSEVVDNEDVYSRAVEVAREIAALPPTAVRLAKAHIYRTAHSDLETSLQMAASFQANVQSTQEHIDAVNDVLTSLSSRDR